MRTLLLLCIVLLLQAGEAFSQRAINDPTERWQHHFQERMSVIEQRFGMQFEEKWKPVVRFGIPAEIINMGLAQKWGGVYMLVTGSFVLNPEYRDQPADTSLIDHELFHALIDHQYRIEGKGTWPNLSLMETASQNMLLQTKLKGEGISNYYERELHSREKEKVHSDYEIPRRVEEIESMDEFVDFLNEAGYLLVEPIIHRYGRRGALYLMENETYISPSDMAASIRLYQQKALADLASQEVRKGRVP